MKKIIRVTVFEKERYDGEWPPEDAAGAIAWLSEKIKGISARRNEDANSWNM